MLTAPRETVVQRLRQPLPLDDQDRLIADKAHWRLEAAREHLEASFLAAVRTLVRSQQADTSDQELRTFTEVLAVVLPTIHGTGSRSATASRLSRVCLQVEEAAHDFASALAEATRSYEAWRQDEEDGHADGA